MNSHDEKMSAQAGAHGAARIALFALLAGAVGIAFAPIFVRLSDLGPSAIGFHRVFLSLPVLWLWTEIGARRNTGPTSRTTARVPVNSQWIFAVLSGLFFAADIALWHWSIRLTSVANATLLANFAPVFVALGAWLLLNERISFRFMVALFIALCGMAMVMGASIGHERHLLGDLLGILTAVFYAGYILSVKRLRETMATGPVMFWTGIFSAAALLPIALLSGEGLIAGSLYGWAVLGGLALISHCGGQGLIAYALAHLPASFSSLALLLQPVVAAFLAWGLLAEPLGLLQSAGGIVVLFGIFLASRTGLPAPSTSEGKRVP